MPHGIVDGLEAVEIEKEQSQFAAGALGLVDGMLQAVVQQHPVGQMGQGVVIGEIVQTLLVFAQAAFSLSSFGNIGGNADNAHDLSRGDFLRTPQGLENTALDLIAGGKFFAVQRSLNIMLQLRDLGEQLENRLSDHLGRPQPHGGQRAPFG